MVNLNHIHNIYMVKISLEIDENKIKQLFEEYSKLMYYYALHDISEYEPIKACPFCGHSAEFTFEELDFSIRCSNSYCHMHGIVCDLKEWNARPKTYIEN